MNTQEALTLLREELVALGIYRNCKTDRAYLALAVLKAELAEARLPTPAPWEIKTEDERIRDEEAARLRSLGVGVAEKAEDKA